mgnify:CR=1 FL=1
MTPRTRYKRPHVRSKSVATPVIRPSQAFLTRVAPIRRAATGRVGRPAHHLRGSGLLQCPGTCSASSSHCVPHLPLAPPLTLPILLTGRPGGYQQTRAVHQGVGHGDGLLLARLLRLQELHARADVGKTEMDKANNYGKEST